MSWKPTLLASRGALPRRTADKAIFVGALLASVLLAHTAVAPTGNIIILNSDAGVAKYREVETAFRSSIGRPVVSLDVASMSESALRRAIGGRGDLLYCIGAQAYKSATEMTRGSRIVFSSAINWKRFKRGDDTHVIDNDLPAETQLTLFRHFFPEVRRVGVLYNRTINRQWFTEAEATGRRLGIEVIGYSVSRPSRVDNGLRELTPKVDALWLIPDPVVLDDEETIRIYFDMAHAANRPVFAYSAAFEALKPTLIIAPDMPTIGRQAADIFQNLTTARDVYFPAGSEVILNLGRVREYGLEFNRDSLDSVNRIIR
jgi:putative ABC transport system substrate-binding protein